MLLSLFKRRETSFIIIIIIIIIMCDFTFDNKFCKYFVNLRQLYIKVLVSFNVDQCLSRKTGNISISLFYDEKLEIEKEKKTLDLFARM